MSDLQRTANSGQHRPVIVVAATNVDLRRLDSSFTRCACRWQPREAALRHTVSCGAGGSSGMSTVGQASSRTWI